MAVKKIQVWSDDSDQGITPEEEQRIEHKVDTMLSMDEDQAVAAPDPEKPDKKIAKTAKKTTSAPKPPKVLVITSSEDSDEVVPGPPEVVADLGIDKPDEPAKNEAEPEVKPAAEVDQLAPAAVPSSAVHIEIDEADLADIKDESEPIDEEPLIVEENLLPAEEVEEKLADENPDNAQEPESAPKKYRPPEGPLQFKRRLPNHEEITATNPLTAEDDAARASAAVDSALSQSLESIRPAKAVKRPRPKKAKASRKKLLAIVAMLLLVIIVLAAAPFTRAKALNLFGVRGTLAVTVLDAETNQPLSAAQITVADRTASTDERGLAKLSDVSLGDQTVTVSRAAYTTQSVKVSLPWRSTASVTAKLPTGSPRHYLTVRDTITGRPVRAASATVAGTSYNSGLDGKIGVVTDPASQQKITVAATGYQSKTLTNAELKALQQIELIPSASDIYVAQAAGRYNVYAREIGATSGRVILAGTGRETTDMAAVPDALATRAAVVSTRDSQADKTGYLLDVLTVVDVKTGEAAPVAKAATIKVAGWSGNRLIYGALKADAAANDKQRYGLFSYDTASKQSVTLEQANSLNDVLLVGNRVYYATSNKVVGGVSAFMAINSDGQQKRQLLGAEVGTINRVDASRLLLNATDGWYAYQLGDTKTTKTSGAQTAQAGRLYIESPFNGVQSAWIDTSKGTITVQNGNQAQTIGSISDAAYPLRWLTPQTLLYRGSSASGVGTDYAVDIGGAGGSIQVADVTNAPGLKLWHN